MYEIWRTSKKEEKKKKSSMVRLELGPFWSVVSDFTTTPFSPIGMRDIFIIYITIPYGDSKQFFLFDDSDINIQTIGDMCD